MLVAVLIFLSALSLGLPLARPSSRQGDPLMLACYALGSGLIVLALLIHVLGSAGWLSPHCSLLLLLLPCLRIRPVLTLLSQAALEWREQIGLAPLVLLAWISLCALAPNTHFDVQVYHYAFPEIYAREHSLSFARANNHEGLIGAAHLIYIPALQLGGESAANLVNSFYLLILLIACRRISARPVVWLLLSSPLIIFQAQGGLTDLAAAAYVCLALEAMLRDSPQPGWAGLWAGQALAVKLTALSNYLCILLLAVARRRLGWTLGLGILLLIPQLSRNYAATGDPFFPFSVWRWVVFGKIPANSTEPLRIPVADRWGRFPMNLFHLSLADRSWQNAYNPLILAGILLAFFRPRQPLRGVTALALTGLALAAPSNPPYAFPTLCWCACVTAQWLECKRFQIPLLIISCSPGVAVLIALSLQRATLRHGWEAYLDQRTSYAGYRFLAQRARPDQIAYLLGRGGFRCPIAYVCGDDPPSNVALPKIDYYVADLREPFLIPALLGELVRQHRGLWVDPDSLRVGPLAALSREELCRAMRDLGYAFDAEGRVFLERALNDRPKLKMHGVFEARLVFSQARVVVLEVSTEATSQSHPMSLGPLR